MSIKIEQRLIGETVTDNSPVIYSTGVYLRPLKVLIDNKPHFVWVAHSFNDDSFFEGREISPNVIGNSINDMFST